MQVFLVCGMPVFWVFVACKVGETDNVELSKYERYLAQDKGKGDINLMRYIMIKAYIEGFGSLSSVK